VKIPPSKKSKTRQKQMLSNKRYLDAIVIKRLSKL